MGALPFAVWLCPEAEQERALSTQMEQLFQRYETPRFAPHMTLLGGRFRDEQELRSAFATALEGKIAPIRLDVLGLEHSQAYFMTFFIKLASSGALQELLAHMRACLDPDSPYEIRPHLSLIYAQMDAVARGLLSENFELHSKTLVFDRLSLVVPSNRELGWNDIGSWRVLDSHQLTTAFRA